MPRRKTSAKPSNGIHIQAQSFISMIPPQPLRFAPPYANRSPNPAGYTKWWELFRYVYDLPDPNRFPPLGGFPPEDREVLQGYVEATPDLADSSILNRDWGFSGVSDELPGSMDITWDFPAKDVIRGVTTLFRQFASTNKRDPYRYSRVRLLIDRRVQEVDDADRDLRREYIARWNQTHTALNRELLSVSATRRLFRDKAWAFGRAPGDNLIPRDLLARFQYGEYIHRDEFTAELRELQARDPFLYNFQTMYFMAAMVQLSHFYLGYSLLVARALGA